MFFSWTHSLYGSHLTFSWTFRASHGFEFPVFGGLAYKARILPTALAELGLRWGDRILKTTFLSPRQRCSWSVVQPGWQWLGHPLSQYSGLLSQQYCLSLVMLLPLDSSQTVIPEDTGCWLGSFSLPQTTRATGKWHIQVELLGRCCYVL